MRELRAIFFYLCFVSLLTFMINETKPRKKNCSRKSESIEYIKSTSYNEQIMSAFIQSNQSNQNTRIIHLKASAAIILEF